MPNPESALNEEAGKLLLEHYDDYCRRAKMMTEIHARLPKQAAASSKAIADEPCCSAKTSLPSESSTGPVAKKHAGEKSTKPTSAVSSNCPQKSKSLPSKDKRRTLKRL